MSQPDALGGGVLSEADGSLGVKELDEITSGVSAAL